MAERSLHIGVDARELVGLPTGVGRYLMGLLREWAGDASFPHRLTLFLPARPPPAASNLGPRMTFQVEPAERAGTWWEQTRLPRAAARARVDVFLAAGYTAPLRLTCPSVVAIYDVSFFAHPEWFTAREGWRRRKLTRASAHRAREIITISEFSAAEIVRWLGVARARVHLAPPGPPAVARPTPAPARQRSVLFAGSLLNRRHIPELLQAFALVAARVPDARLILAGDNRTTPRIDPVARAADLGVADRVDWRSYVPDDELERLYWSASVFAFLSDYEGFAMTPLEAAAHDVPLVLLDSPIAREIYADGALLVSPEPARIAEAMILLLTDARAHARAQVAGRARVSAYSWATTAAAVRAALERAASA